MANWFLEGVFGPRKTLQRIRLAEFPFFVGRGEDCSLVLNNARLSRRHARIDRESAGQLVLRDLGSTNGTFLNQTRLDEQVPVREGDVVRFAEEEFRVVSDHSPDSGQLNATVPGIGVQSDTNSQRTHAMHRMLLDGQVTALFQPIVERETKQVFAYEMLGRGSHPDLPESPVKLFATAHSLGLAVQLSELMRRVGAHLAHMSHPDGCFFTNVHPLEMDNLPRLTGQVRELRRHYPDLSLVLEVHESTVTRSGQLLDLKDAMAREDVLLAYDDFGAGQARLLELAEAPPHFVKLDASLVRDIYKAPQSRREMVRMVVDYCRQHDIATIAEGVAGGRDAVFCSELGIDYLQGYYFGYPEDLERKPK